VLRLPRLNVIRAGLAAAIVAAAGCAPAPATPPPTPAGTEREAALSAARALIANVPFATLVTVDSSGAPQSRIVEPFPPEDDLTVWVATTGVSRKVKEIERDGRVVLTYFDRTAPGYVTLAGTAAVVRDPVEKAKRWKESWAGFYKDKNRGEDYTLIRITPSRLEISSPSQGMNNDPVTWKPVTVQLR
jgi:PPOX class probable F420-dependent enzyme